MMCYRDRWWCSYWEGCEEGVQCTRAATSSLQAKAKRFGLPLDLTVEEPNCFKKKTERPVREW